MEQHEIIEDLAELQRRAEALWGRLQEIRDEGSELLCGPMSLHAIKMCLIEAERDTGRRLLAKLGGEG